MALRMHRIAIFCVACLLWLAPQNAGAQAGVLAVTIERTDVHCPGERNGVIKLTLNTGGLPVRYDWISPVNSLSGVGELNVQDPVQKVDSLPSGAYRFVFTLANGTAVTEWVTLEEPQAIRADIFAEGDKCLDEDKGLIRIDSIWGGVPPYQIAFAGGAPAAQRQWTQLKAGPYFLYITDQRGCGKREGVVLPTGLEFLLEIGSDTAIFSGDTLRVALASNRPLATAVWTPARYARSERPAEARLFPFRTETFTVYAVDINGCAAEDTKTIYVRNSRRIYAPNAFAPGGAHRENASFWLFSDGGIARVELLQVLDRAGRVWFTERDAGIEETNLGWTGEFNGHPAPPGVYVWQARLRYTNGEVNWLQGDVTLVR